MARLTPDEIAEKWAGKTAAASGDYQRGVERVSESPGQAAARKVEKYEAGVRDNVGKWKERVGNVSLSDWQRATVEKGAARYASGAQQAQGKMAEFQREFQPFQERVTQQVRSMPDTTQEQRFQRALAQMKGTAQFRRGRGSGGSSL